jgi:hypothetical protein
MILSFVKKQFVPYFSFFSKSLNHPTVVPIRYIFPKSNLPNLYRKNKKNPIKDSFVKESAVFLIKKFNYRYYCIFSLQLTVHKRIMDRVILVTAIFDGFFLLLRYIMCSFKCILKVGVEKSIVNASPISYLNLL